MGLVAALNLPGGCALRACPRLLSCCPSGAGSGSNYEFRPGVFSRAWGLRCERKARGGGDVDAHRRRRATQRSQRNPHAPFGFRAARGHLRRWRSSTMCTDIACVAPPCICPPGTRNATPPNSRTDSQSVSVAKRLFRIRPAQPRRGGEIIAGGKRAARSPRSARDMDGAPEGRKALY